MNPLNAVPLAALFVLSANELTVTMWTEPGIRWDGIKEGLGARPWLSRQVSVSLKRLRKKGASIALEPANAAYETRIFGPDRVKIQGRLAGIYRRYN